MLSHLKIFVHLSPVLVDPVQVEHGEALVAGGGAAGGRQGQRAALLQLLRGNSDFSEHEDVGVADLRKTVGSYSV